ncbi:hypothetical protein GCM10010915_24860 [Microbacterium faecale]|uniref:Uncharacterized protein n=1 Tax=Microbacterium faecale TaxID=1804630 RepID=A0A916YEY0_9MICO|nr:hypothetical protein GCM10010915_24860 [Microbacterium faecale]
MRPPLTRREGTDARQHALARGSVEIARCSSVLHEHDLVCDGSGRRIVRDHDDGLSELIHARPQEAQESAARFAVERTCRLVRDDEIGAGEERAGNGDALPLTARELGRKVAEPVGDAESVDELGTPRTVGSSARERCGEIDVLTGGEVGEEVTVLEDESDPVSSRRRERRVVEPAEIGVSEQDLPGRRLVESGQTVQERRLAGAGRAHDRREPSGGKVDAEAVQSADSVLARAILAHDVQSAGGELRRGVCGDGTWVIGKRMHEHHARAAALLAASTAGTVRAGPARPFGRSLEHREFGRSGDS